jgi:hypothetical protein
MAHSARALRSLSEKGSDKEEDKSACKKDSLDKKFDLILSELKDIKTEQKDLISSIVDLQAKFDDIKTELSVQNKKLQDCYSECEQLKTHNNKLTKDVSELKMKLNETQQYTRSNSVEICGIPMVSGENLNNILENLGNVLKFKFQHDAVDVAHRLQVRANGSADIIVKFLRRSDANELVRLSREKKGFPASNLGFASVSRVYVNPSLTPLNKFLFREARLLRNKGCKYVWFQRGRVCIRKSSGERVHIINSENDLEEFVKTLQIE